MKLLTFIKQARAKGYDDYQIKDILIKHNWTLDKIEKAFSKLTPKYKFKNKVTLFLSSEILKKLDKRAKKNMFTLSEQIEDILRRSCALVKSKKETEKLDDSLVSLFSRKR